MKKISNLREEVLGIVLKNLNISLDKINDKNISMNKIPQWDSVAHVEIISSLEDKYEFQFTSEEISSFTSFQNILNVVEKKINIKK